MNDKIVTSVGFGMGMMIYLSFSLLDNSDDITIRNVATILLVGGLCGGMWFLIFDKIKKQKKG